MDENWNYLVILDACRYDFFFKLHPDYLIGELRKVISLGSSTLEWCKKSFQKAYDDVIYVSANPYINSKGEVKGFKASNHFYKVIDVWDWGWDEDLGTVHPKRVNEIVRSVKDDYPDRRLIIHYLQPHAPYLTYDLPTHGFSKPHIGHGHPLAGVQNGRNHGVFEENLPKLLRILIRPTGFFGGNLLWKFHELLNLPPVSPMDATRRRFGNIGLKYAYIQNLALVLDYVANLVEDLSGVIVVTADHGEYLGEEGRYSHSDGCRDPLLLEVPWLLVNKTVSREHFQGEENKRKYTWKSPEKTQKREKEKIKSKLRELGYM